MRDTLRLAMAATAALVGCAVPALTPGAAAEELEFASGLEFAEDGEIRSLAGSAFHSDPRSWGPLSLGGRAYLRADAMEGPSEVLLEGSLSLRLDGDWSLGLGWRYGPAPEQGGHTGGILFGHRF